MKIMAMLGVVQDKGQGGQNAQGTQAGEQPATLPELSMNPMNPTVGIEGNGFYPA
jgi:hypothetical protein